MEHEVSPPPVAEGDDALAAASNCLIGAIHVAGNFDQVRQNIRDVAGEAPADVDDLKIDVRLVAVRGSAVGSGLPWRDAAPELHHRG